MKESGSGVVGRMPAHWDVKPIRRLFRSLDGRRIPIESAYRGLRQGDIPYYGASGIIDTVDDFIFNEPLVLVCEDGWNLLIRSQLVARPLTGKAWVNNHAHVLRPNYGDVEFWAAAIEQTPFDLFVTGMRQPKLTGEALKSIYLPAPPDFETRQIAAEVKSIGDRFETIKLSTELSVEKLREYRQALITAAVTGKIDVSKEAA